jgi:hypothetical protein
MKAAAVNKFFLAAMKEYIYSYNYTHLLQEIIILFLTFFYGITTFVRNYGDIILQ